MTTYATTMTFGDLIAEVRLLRFASAQDASIARWIQLAYGQLWGMEDWTFRRAKATVGTTSGAQAMTGVPADFGSSRGLWNADGAKLKYLDIGQFYDQFTLTSVQGTPAFYTIVNDTIQVGPTPTLTASTHTLLYDKVATQLTVDTDVPSIPALYHYALVPGALQLGLALHNDFTYEFIGSQWQAAIAAMRRDYLIDTTGEIVQAGAFRPAPGNSLQAASWVS